MKIISLEKDYGYGLFENILVPCMILQAPSKIKKNRKLNFLEETVYRLGKVKPSLLDDVYKLKKYLGFYSEDEKDEDYTQILQTAIQKIKDCKLEEEEEEEKILTFYQELYTGKLLPVVTVDPIETTRQIKNEAFKQNPFIRKVDFIKSPKNPKKITAYWYSAPQKNRFYISVEDAIEAIYKHNLNRYENFQRIDLSNLYKKPEKKEAVLLNVKAYFLENGEFVLTNGFSGDFSILLTDVFKNTKCYELIKVLREDKKETKSSKQTSVVIPYDTHDKTIKEKLSIIEYYFNEFDPHSQKDINIQKEKLITSLFDVIEYAMKCNESEIDLYKDEIRKEELLADIAESIGFKADKKMNIFHVTSKEGIKIYLAVLLISSPEKLKKISKNYPDFIINLNTLLYYRNGLKHSSKSEILEKIDINKISEYKKEIYAVLEILLNLNRNETRVFINRTQFSLNNAYINTENGFETGVWQKIPGEVKDMLVYADYLLHEEDFSQNRTDIINNVSVNLSAVFEYMFKDIYKNYHFQKCSDTKDDIIKKYKITDEELISVSEEKLNSALKGLNASLGAYFLLYINFYGVQRELFDLIIKLLRIRRHANISYEEALKIDKAELVELYEKTKREVTKIIKEKYNG